MAWSETIVESSANDRDRLLERFGAASGPDNTALTRALDYALSARGGPDTIPHSIEVAAILKDLGVDETTLVATLLSDRRLRERLSPEEIKEEFGADVADLVVSVHWLNTFKECEHETVQTPQQAERLRRMLLAMVKDIRALLIKLAYRLQRLQILARERYETRRCIARETLDIFAPLANRLGIRQLKWRLEDLAFRYLEPQAYKQLAKALEESRVEREAYVERLVTTLEEALHREGLHVEVSGRPKHIYSIWRKLQHKQRHFEQLYDVRALRVIVDKLAECYAALGIVHTLWQHIPKEFDDYIANPKDNGYRSLHTAVMGPQGKVIEVQIRTREMHEFAERGVAAHWVYKEGGGHDAAVQRSITSLQQMLEKGKGDAALLERFHTEVFQDRVFVFTPDGDVMDLPRGSTPLDFAYSVHTEIGHRCRGAKVNGRIVPLNYTLESGERVEILTAKQGHPSQDWLNAHRGYLHTSRARAKVRHWFKAQDRGRNLQEGRALVERELQRLGLKEADLAAVPARFNLHSVDELLVEIGRGEIGLMQLAGVLQVPDLSERQVARQVSRRRAKARPDRGGVTVQGVGNLLTQFARCCKPMPGDPIVGYITRGQGVTIHREDCANVLRLSASDANRMMQVEWGSEQRVYPVDVRIEAYDRRGLLRDITAILSNDKVNLLRANTQTNQCDQTVTMDLTLEVESTAQLSRVLDKFVQVPNVLEARRHAS